MFPRSLILALALLSAPAGVRGDERGLPLVRESVDELCVICFETHSKVLFFRDGQLLATRVFVDGMHYRANGPLWELAWEDYWQAERIVSAPKLSFWPVEHDPTEAPCGDWWAMARPMRDLRAPRRRRAA